MKRLIPIVLVLWASTVGAQTLMTSTTLAAAMTATQTSLIVSSASGSGWAVNNYAYVDYEVVKITNINGTLMGVTRQQFGTRAVSHANGATILAGAGGHFRSLASYQHAPPVGPCVRADQTYLPIIDYTSGNLWTCSLSLGKWIGTNTAALVYNSIMTPSY